MKHSWKIAFMLMLVSLITGCTEAQRAEKARIDEMWEQMRK